MTPQEALQILDSGCANVPANREVHVKFQEAVQTIAKAIAPAPEKESEENT